MDELDAYRAANLLIQQYGERSLHLALERRANWVQPRIRPEWRPGVRIAAAVQELQRAAPGPGDRLQ